MFTVDFKNSNRFHSLGKSHAWRVKMNHSLLLSVIQRLAKYSNFIIVKSCRNLAFTSLSFMFYTTTMWRQRLQKNVASFLFPMLLFKYLIALLSCFRRFMLQLAQKTDGVIVTNDNLRDLSDESTVWRDIIKKR